MKMKKKEWANKAWESKSYIQAMWESRNQEYWQWETQCDCWTWAVLRCCAEELVVLAFLSPWVEEFENNLFYLWNPSFWRRQAMMIQFWWELFLCPVDLWKSSPWIRSRKTRKGLGKLYSHYRKKVWGFSEMKYC